MESIVRPSAMIADDTPFDGFYRSAWRDAARWAAALTGEAQAGEEIAQEVFLRLAGRYDELENPAAYLRTAVVNAARSWHRSAARRSAREHLAVVGEGDEVLVVDELLESLARLRYEQRAVLV
ncbi:MAG: hypothetical protein H0U21_11140, partial [Acidimicrobiia bacterium]|nr:hypothetical protein [Acidimicrobiia bacterium]